MNSARHFYARIRALWPTTLDYSKNAGSTSHAWQIYEAIEELIAPHDELLKLANWAYYQAVDSLVRKPKRLTLSKLQPRCVSFHRFSDCMLDNLSDDSWRNYRRQYLR